MIVVTATAPVNIAVIKYWGKRDEELILPINGSISTTLDSTQLRAKTTIAASALFASDRLWLNGVEQSMNNDRLRNVLKEIRRRACKRKREGDPEDESPEVGCSGGREVGRDAAGAVVEEGTLSTGAGEVSAGGWKVHICSENNFPTAAGLASSAAGLACLVFTLAKVFSVEGDLSDIASVECFEKVCERVALFKGYRTVHRQGSGSACRSVYGGFVEWCVGVLDDGSDSIARQIAPESHWPDMHVLILVVSAGTKHTPSTGGMLTSVGTSALLAHRAHTLVPRALTAMRAAILDRDFEAFANLTMRDSNQMHATCLDTYPPIAYLTDTSHDIMRLVHAFNSHLKTTQVAYTFDAGPNACLYTLADQVPLVLGLIYHFFPPSAPPPSAPAHSQREFVTGLKGAALPPTEELIRAMPLEPRPGALQYVIHTRVGGGPRVLTDRAESLLNDQGLPLRLRAS